MEKRELSYTIGGSVNGYDRDGEDMEVPPEKLYTELPCESAIPFQSMYSEKTIIQEDTCTPGFTAHCLRQPRQGSHLSTYRQMGREEVAHVTVEYDSATGMNMILPFAATWMDLETLIASDVSQAENDKYHLHAKYKTLVQMNLFTNKKQNHRYRKQTYSHQRGKLEVSGR